MRHRFSFILLVIFGSFCVYCAQNVVGGSNNGNGNGNGGNGGGGMVGNAGADTCCTPPDPPPASVLFDQKFVGTVQSVSCWSPAIDVAGNHTIVVHGSPQYVQWSFGGAAGWVTQSYTANNSAGVVVLDGRLGKQLRLAYAAQCTNTGGCSCDPQFPVAMTVVGYKQ